jgi:hypothetical protein
VQRSYSTARGTRIVEVYSCRLARAAHDAVPALTLSLQK